MAPSQLNLANLHDLLSTADFFKIIFLTKIFQESTIRMSNSLDSDQARLSVGPDLGPNCLQRVSADDTSSQRVNEALVQIH